MSSNTNDTFFHSYSFTDLILHFFTLPTDISILNSFLSSYSFIIILSLYFISLTHALFISNHHLTLTPYKQTGKHSCKSTHAHTLNYMITLKQNHTHDRPSKQAKSFTRSVAHVIAALMLTSVWKAGMFLSMCNLAVMSEDLTLGWGY